MQEEPSCTLCVNGTLAELKYVAPRLHISPLIVLEARLNIIFKMDSFPLVASRDFDKGVYASCSNIRVMSRGWAVGSDKICGVCL